MNRHCTKAELYRAICALRKRLNIPESDQPLDMISLCEALPNLALGFPPFKTPGLKGVSCLSTDGGPDIILLNGNLSWRENNFTCGHELIHITLHRDGPAKSFNCFEKARPNQDRFLEWQANEGAAELLLPTRVLLPLVRERYPALHTWKDYLRFKGELAENFRITEAVVTFRFESLKYEITQYLSGIPYEEVRILSSAKQRESGLHIKSLNDLEAECLAQESDRLRRIHRRMLDFHSIDIAYDRR